MEAICPKCFNAVEADSLASGNALLCGSCGQSFRIQLSSTILRKDFGDTKTEVGTPLVSQQRLGRFVLLDVLGRGGFGEVFRGFDTDLQRIVAVKVPNSAFVEQEELLERMSREARSAGQLHHPAIVAVLEWGQEGSLPFIVYEFVQGTTLSNLLATRRFSYQESAIHVRDIARGLQYAHERGVTHRDVKPSNIMVDDKGKARLTDFGLAKFENCDGMTLTKPGDILGTVAYLSPEQAAGRIDAIDGQTDIYCLGATLYEMLTGRRPFSGSPLELIHKAIHEEPTRSRTLHPDIPIDLEAICQKAMEKEKKRRYRTARDFADDLENWLEYRPTTVRPINALGRAARWCRRNRLLASSIAVVAATLMVATIISSISYLRADRALRQSRERLSMMYVKEANDLKPEDVMLSLPWLAGALALDEGNPEREPVSRIRLEQALAQCPKLESMWFHAAAIAFAALSPDGKHLLTLGIDKAARLWSVETGQAIGEPWLHDAELNHADFDSSGEYVVVGCSDGTAHVWEVRTGRMISNLVPSRRPNEQTQSKSVDKVHFAPLDASKSDRLIAVTASADHTARVWDARIGKELARLDHNELVYDALFDSSGETVLTASADRTARIWKWRVDESKEDSTVTTRQLNHQSPVFAAAFSPNDHVIATGSGDGSILLWDPRSGQKLETAPIRQIGAVHEVHFSSDGQYLATASPDQTARVWQVADGKPVCDPLRHSEAIATIDFNPAGTYLATAGREMSACVWEIASGKPVTPRLICGRSVTRALFTSEHTGTASLITTSKDGIVRKWEIAREPIVTTLPHSAPIDQVAAATAGDRILLISKDRAYPAAVYAVSDKSVSLLANLSLPEQPIHHQQSISCGALSTDGTLAATGSFDRSVIIWNVTTGTAITGVLPVEQFPRSLEFSRSGKYVLGTTRRGSSSVVYVWHVPSGECVFERQGQIADARLDPRADRIGYVEGNAICLQDLDKTSASPTLLSHPNAVTQFRFTSDGNRVVSVGSDELIRVWSPVSAKEIFPAAPMNEPVVLADLDGSGEIALTATNEKVRVCRLAKGADAELLITFPMIIEQAALSPNCRLLMTRTKDGLVQVHDARTGELVSNVLRNGRHITHALFTQNATRLLIVAQNDAPDGNAIIEVIRLESSGESVQNLMTRSKLLSSHAVAAAGKLELLSRDQLRSLGDVAPSEVAPSFITGDQSP